MPIGTPERRAQLIQYVQESIQKVEVGETTRLPTYQDLADQFGYRSPSSLRAFLGRRGLMTGRLKTSEKPYQIPEPSVDLSWFLGVLSAGGNVELASGRIRLTSAHENVLEKYRLIGENLFLLNIHGEPGSGWSRSGYEFDSVRIAKFLGDLKDDGWARTILTQHSWIVDNSRYSWGFITGFFDKRGGAYTYKTPPNRTKRLVLLSTSSQIGANLLTEMLVRGGLEYPGMRSESLHEQIRGVTIYNFKDLQLFAQHIHSVVPEKEEDLDRYRTIDLKESVRGRIYVREKLIDEWKFIKGELNRAPKWEEIYKLRQDGKVRVSPATYAKRFGQGSFVKAREEIERIIRDER